MILVKKEKVMKTKMKFQSSITIPTILYITRKKNAGKLNAMKMKHLRMVLGKTKLDREKN